MRRLAPWAALAVTLVLAPGTARAFCGFYVDGSGTKLFNHATQVVMMRDGTRTVLSMQNNYQGPPEAFAMVVPVPVVLHQKDVVTLDPAVFARVDKLDAPRLVEYWEQDPCAMEPEEEGHLATRRKGSGTGMGYGRGGGGLGVTIEAKFVVGEYDVVVLSAKDSTGLDTWLRQEKYSIPEGAEPYLRPYVEGGWKFFVAKVDPAKVKFHHGMATLSPLRFYYDSDSFTLPVRLGLINSSGTQDLIVHILSRTGRYQVANRRNVFIPTNLDVKNEVRTRFAEFYAALFDRTVETHPGAVVTEYAWDARSCDPCPEPPLRPNELASLGADVLGTSAGDAPGLGGGRSGRGYYGGGGFVLTRLHVRYRKHDLKDDLVFEQADAVVGGREWPMGDDARPEQGAKQSRINTFQARYVIRHPWTGPIACANPVRGRWGGPPEGDQLASSRPVPATNLAFAPRGKAHLALMVAADVPALDVHAAGVGPAPVPPPATSPRKPFVEEGGEAAAPAPKAAKPGCGCGAGGDGAGSILVLLIAARWRRRNRKEKR